MSPSLKKARTLYRQQLKAKKQLPIFIFLFWFLLLTSAGIFSVWTSSQVLEEQYQIAQLNQKISELEIKNHQLKGEVARLESPARLEKIARARLGLVYPEPSQILSLGRRAEQVQVALP